jgi:hypothetical protein
MNQTTTKKETKQLTFNDFSTIESLRYNKNVKMKYHYNGEDFTFESDEFFYEWCHRADITVKQESAEYLDKETNIYYNNGCSPYYEELPTFFHVLPNTIKSIKENSIRFFIHQLIKFYQADYPTNIPNIQQEWRDYAEKMLNLIDFYKKKITKNDVQIHKIETEKSIFYLKIKLSVNVKNILKILLGSYPRRFKNHFNTLADNAFLNYFWKNTEMYDFAELAALRNLNELILESDDFGRIEISPERAYENYKDVCLGEMGNADWIAFVKSCHSNYNYINPRTNKNK